MIRFLKDVFFLGLKEFASLRYDRVMLVLVVYALSIAVVLVARGVKLEVSNAAIAIGEPLPNLLRASRGSSTTRQR